MTHYAVLGVDSGTQSTKVLALDAESGAIVGIGRATHSGTVSQHPEDWWRALGKAIQEAVTTETRVLAISIAAQQHGCVLLDAAGDVVRPASLWNDIASAADAERLNAEADFATETGTRLVPSFTITKLAHLARTAPHDLARTAAVGLPHDWLNFRLTGELTTDRGDASGTGWWSPGQARNRRDLLSLAVGEEVAARVDLPVVRGPDELAGALSLGAAKALGLPAGIPVGPGTGDNMAAALGVGAEPGELVVSLGTSGTVFSVSETPTADPTGEVAGFADATGRFLPLACMLNCTRVVDTIAGLLGIERGEALSRAGAFDPGAGGLLVVPYFSGERTPNLPAATGMFLGMTERVATPDHLLRGALDGVAAGLAYCIDALSRLGISSSEMTLVGGGAVHPAWQQAIADASGLPVSVRAGSEHAARGAAIQAASHIRSEPVAELAARWRPTVSAAVTPRPGMQDAFALTRRAQIIHDLQGHA